MRKTILKLMLVTIVLMPACNRKHTDTPFTVTGKIENVEDGYMILFFKSNDDGSNVTIDIDTLVNGRFEFTALAESGVQYHVMAPHIGIFPSMSVDFYAEPGADVKIHGKDYLTKNWKVSHAGKDQKIYQSYFNQVADVFKDLQTLELECRREGRSLDYLELSEPYNGKIDSIRLTWLKKHKRISHPWMDIMLGSAKSASFSKDKNTMNDLKNIWDRIPNEYKTSPKGKQISIVLYPDGEPLKAGDEFPYETKVYDLEGNGHSLEEFKGKLLLLYFSSHGCKPCIGVKKELEEVFNRGFWEGYYAGRPVAEHSAHYGSAATRRKVYVGKVVNFYKKISVAEVLVEAAPLEVTEEIFFLGPTTGVVEQKCEELHGPDGEITRRVEQGQLCAIRTSELIRRGDQLYKFEPTDN